MDQLDFLTNKLDAMCPPNELEEVAGLSSGLTDSSQTVAPITQIQTSSTTQMDENCFLMAYAASSSALLSNPEEEQAVPNLTTLTSNTKQ